MASSTSQATSPGCWTCKVRRKRCDGAASVCSACSLLQLTCYRDTVKPEWMDGGRRQEEMARVLKTKVKESAHRRRSVTKTSREGPHVASGEWIVISQRPSHIRGSAEDDPGVSDTSHPSTSQEAHTSDTTSDTTLNPAEDGPSAAHDASASVECATNGYEDTRTGFETLPFSGPDTLLISFYLDKLFPFMFPFYEPSILEGGKAWVLELILKGLVVRKAMLCQAAFFFSLAHNPMGQDIITTSLLERSRSAFQILAQALEIINRLGLADHMLGGVRILAGITQLQRFEVAARNFDNCQAHLDASISLFNQLMNAVDFQSVHVFCATSAFDAVCRRLQPSPLTLPGHDTPMPNAEHAAFRFSAAIVCFDDIIASTMLRKGPQLLDIHRSLLTEGSPVDVLGVVGCSNSTLLQIAETSALDAWKQERIHDGTLDMVSLVQRAVSIKEAIQKRLNGMPLEGLADPPDGCSSSILFAHSLYCGARISQSQARAIASIWTHAAMLYLSVVMSGWQRGHHEVKHHVFTAMKLLTELSPAPLLRTVCWPLCVIGCLVLPCQEPQIRQLVQQLQPEGIYGAVYEALDVIERAWLSRDDASASGRGFAAHFDGRDSLVLLV